MKVTRVTIKGRTLNFTDLPDYTDEGTPVTVGDLEVTINYTDRTEDSRVSKAIALDNVIIPAIVKAINGSPYSETVIDHYKGELENVRAQLRTEEKKREQFLAALDGQEFWELLNRANLYETTSEMRDEIKEWIKVNS